MKNLYKTYKSIEESETLFGFGVVSVSMAMLIDGVAKTIHVMVGKEVSLAILILFFLGLTGKLGVLLLYSLSPKFLFGTSNKLEFAKYSTVSSIVGLGVALLFLIGLEVYGVDGHENLLYIPLGFLIYNLYTMVKENKKVRP